MLHDGSTRKDQRATEKASNYPTIWTKRDTKHRGPKDLYRPKKGAREEYNKAHGQYKSRVI